MMTLKSSSTVHWRCFCLLLALLVWVLNPLRGAEASEGPQTAEKDSPELSPPRLLEYVEAEYPPEALKQGLEARVNAKLEIDEQGDVISVEVIEPVGFGFDEAAQAALKEFKFEPARRDGKPVASILTYRYNFFLKPDERSAIPAEPRRVELRGRITDLDDVPQKEVFISLRAVAADGGGFEHTTKTNLDGSFAFVGFPPGTYEVEAILPGYKVYSSTEELVDGERREVVYRLEPDEEEYTVVVRGRKPPREVTRRVVTTEEITKIPGTSGDALRAVQNLPGMARPSPMGGELVVRGSAPEDSAYFFDALKVPYLYHFGGLTSMVNSDLLEKIDFYPGNYSVRYGRSTGGVIDVTTRVPKSDRWHGYVDADIWDAGLLVEGPLNKDWSVAASARRSYIDGVLKAADLFGDDLKMTVAPRYWDFQVIADYHPSNRNQLRLFFCTARTTRWRCFGTTSKTIPTGKVASISICICTRPRPNGLTASIKLSPIA